MPVWSLGREDPLEEVWQPTRVLLPGESPGQRSLVGYGAWGCRVRHDWATKHAMHDDCTALWICWKNSELYTRWWIISQYSCLQKKVQEGASDAAKFMKRVQKCPKHRRRWSEAHCSSDDLPYLSGDTLSTRFLFIPRGVIHSQKQINSIWPKPVAVLLNPIKNTRAKCRLAYEIRGRDTDGCKEGN